MSEYDEGRRDESRYDGGYQKPYGERKEGYGGGQRFTPKPKEPPHGVVYQAYAVAGNKETPSRWLEWGSQMAEKLDAAGFTLRTGGGGLSLEEVFESYASHKELHLPWKGFNQKESTFVRTHPYATELVKKVQPNFEGLKPSVQAIYARNAAVIYGGDLKSPVRFLITYTEDGVENGRDRTSQTGYAGMPIVLAGWLNIPVFNLKNDDAVQRLQRFVEACTIAV
ncbi:MAG: hypothetical protein ACR2HF_02085 [Methylococcaceae bacterium]